MSPDFHLAAAAVPALSAQAAAFLASLTPDQRRDAVFAIDSEERLDGVRHACSASHLIFRDEDAIEAGLILGQRKGHVGPVHCRVDFIARAGETVGSDGKQRIVLAKRDVHRSTTLHRLVHPVVK